MKQRFEDDILNFYFFWIVPRKEGKNLAEVARRVGCSYSVIQNRVVLLGLNKIKGRAETNSGNQPHPPRVVEVTPLIG